MIVLNRKIKAENILFQLSDLVRILGFSFSLKRSMHAFGCYISGKSPLHNQVDFKNGHVVRFSSHPHDIISFMVLFGRKEYGNIKKDSTIIDIGANIGTFALYAGLNGAKTIYAFEPCSEAYQTLKKNIQINKLEDKVVLYNLAVSDRDNEFVSINKNSSPYNETSSTAAGTDKNEMEEIQTISLPTILAEAGTPIDLLKIDCEGLELQILKSCNKKQLSLIRNIRLEFHENQYRKEELFSYLELMGFKKTHSKYNIAWFENSASGRSAN